MPGKEWIRSKVCEEFVEKQLKEQKEEFLASFDRIANSLNDYIEVTDTVTIDIAQLIEKVLMPEREKWEGK